MFQPITLALYEVEPCKKKLSLKMSPSAVPAKKKEFKSLPGSRPLCSPGEFGSSPPTQVLATASDPTFLMHNFISFAISQSKFFFAFFLLIVSRVFFSPYSCIYMYHDLNVVIKHHSCIYKFQNNNDNVFMCLRYHENNNIVEKVQYMQRS